MPTLDSSHELALVACADRSSLQVGEIHSCSCFAHSEWYPGLSHFSKCASRRLSISFFMSLMSVNRPQRVTSQFLAVPSISTINSSTSTRWSRYFSRRCCLQMSAVCCCRFLVPNPMLLPRIVTRTLVGGEFRIEAIRSTGPSPVGHPKHHKTVLLRQGARSQA